MKKISKINSLFIVLLISLSVVNCDKSGTKANNNEAQMNIIFLHHSTGGVIWNGGVQSWFDNYNQHNGTSYQITEMDFPKKKPYGWKNYPYDYWNIWVNHAGDKPYVKKPASVLRRMKAFARSVKNGNAFEDNGEPTLEMLTKDYDMIIWKHCFPVSDILEDTGSPDVTSEKKRVENYKLQYAALKQKMHEFPETKFLVWTGAALVEANTTSEKAQRAKNFFDWVVNDWDEPGDNIYLWDFRALETEGGLFLKNDNARSVDNSHPSEEFAERTAPLFAQRIVDVAEGRSDDGSLTGEVD